MAKELDDIIRPKAKTNEEFVDAWKRHIKELNRLGGSIDIACRISGANGSELYGELVEYIEKGYELVEKIGKQLVLKGGKGE